MAAIDWDSHQKKLNASSLSIKNYCNNNGLNYSTARNKLKKSKKVGALEPKELQQKPYIPKPKPQKSGKIGNLNAVKHFGYARHFATKLLSDTEVIQNNLNQEIAIARMQLALVIQIVGKNPDNIELVMGSSEPIQRLLGRIENLIGSQNRLDNSASSHGDMLESIFAARRSGEISAIEAAYQFMEKGIDVPALLHTEAKIEMEEYEDDSDLPVGGVTPQMIEERERQLLEGSKQSSADFLAERLAALEELNRNETKQS